MKNYREIWKALANSKRATNADSFAYCVLRAMDTENPKEALDHLLKRHYKPRTSKKWDKQYYCGEVDRFAALWDAKTSASYRINYGDRILNVPCSDIFESDIEKEAFNELVKGINRGQF